MDSDSIEQIMELIQKTKNNIMNHVDPHRNYDIVFLVGNTGSGKTTLSSILAGYKVMIKPYHSKDAILEYEGIKPGCKSETKEPNIMINADHNLLIADCPGFCDTNGIGQEIVNAYAIDCLLDTFSSNRIKILLVISASEIDTNRAQNAFENFKRIELMFPDKKQLKISVGVIFTKSNDGWDGSDYFEQLNDNPPENGKEWCAYFLEHPEKVFKLAKASRTKINQLYEYEDLDELISFLKHDQIENPIHRIALSSTADAIIRKWETTIYQKINEIIEKIFMFMHDVYCKETNMQELNKWSNMFGMLSITKDLTIEKFEEIVHKCLTNCQLSDPIKKLYEYEAFYSFICKVLDIKSSKISHIIHKKTKVSIKQLDPIRQLVQINEMKEAQIKYQQKIAEEQEKKILKNQKEAEAKILKMQKKIDKQNFQMDEMKDKLNIYTNYNIISKPTTRKISSDFSWQQVYSRPGITEKELKGILIYLTEEMGGNINDNGTIQITSNSIKNCQSTPKNIVNYTTLGDKTVNYYQSKNKGGSYICFDFLDLKIEIQSYLLKMMSDNYLKNWILEGSNNNIDWTPIDIRNDCEGTNVENVRIVMKANNSNDVFYRYVKLRQTGPNWQNRNEMMIGFIEFYGRILIPKF